MKTEKYHPHGGDLFPWRTKNTLSEDETMNKAVGINLIEILLVDIKKNVTEGAPF